jgi:hypothetical protein
MTSKTLKLRHSSQWQDYNMATTILPKKAGFEQPIATDDTHHEQMASDPTIQQFPQGSTFGQSSAFGGPSAFGTPQSGGFGASAGSGFGQSGAMAPQPQPNLTAAGSNAAQGADVLVANDNTDWINKKWRPAMGWMYMLTCTVDFVVFPVLWSLLQALSKGQVTSQWQPLTLQGAGLYHIAMGAVLGIAAYGRTKEKLEGAAK